MARPYFTLAIRTPSGWSPEFGDYDREAVEFERDDYRDGFNGLRAADLKIIRTADDCQATINAAITKLNA